MINLSLEGTKFLVRVLDPHFEWAINDGRTPMVWNRCRKDRIGHFLVDSLILTADALKMVAKAGANSTPTQGCLKRKQVRALTPGTVIRLCWNDAPDSTAILLSRVRKSDVSMFCFHLDSKSTDNHACVDQVLTVVGHVDNAEWALTDPNEDDEDDDRDSSGDFK